MIFFIGIFYFLLGSIFIILPLLYLELARPKDLIKAGLNLTAGMYLVIKYKVFDYSYSIVLFVLTLLITFYTLEIFTTRWNQLTDKEKDRLKNYLEFKKNIRKFFEAFNIGFTNISTQLNIFKIYKNNENIIKKKWVRNNENDNILTADKKN